MWWFIARMSDGAQRVAQCCGQGSGEQNRLRAEEKRSNEIIVVNGGIIQKYVIKFLKLFELLCNT